MQKTPLVRMASKQKNLPSSIASINNLPHKPQKELIFRHIKIRALLKFTVELIEGDVHFFSLIKNLMGELCVMHL